MPLLRLKPFAETIDSEAFEGSLVLSLLVQYSYLLETILYLLYLESVNWINKYKIVPYTLDLPQKSLDTVIKYDFFRNLQNQSFG
jgi:hypothetical protein